jgi:hypothetical protein
VSFVHGLELWTPQNGAHRKSFPAATPSWKLTPWPHSKHAWTVAADDGVRFARVRWEINFLDIGKTVEHNKNYLLLVTQYYYLLYNANSFDPTMGSSSSGQEQKIGDMKCTWKCLTGSRSVYIDLYIYISM